MWENLLNGIDVSNNTNLNYLGCFGNPLGELDVLSNTALTILACSSTSITSLDVSSNVALDILSVSNNFLTDLDVSTNKNLTILSCLDNLLTSLDVSNNTTLTQLECRKNKLTSLDLKANSKLTFVNCRYNSLMSLNINNGNNINFTEFNARNNENLLCIKVDDVEYMDTVWILGKDSHTFYSETVCPFSVIVNVLPENSGEIAGNGYYYKGDTAKLTATPLEGFKFASWDENQLVLSYDENYSFKVDTHRILTANLLLILTLLQQTFIQKTLEV